MNDFTTPIRMFCCALVLCLSADADAQDTHALRLKLDDVSALLASQQRRLSVPDRMQLNEALGELQRDLERTLDAETELESMRRKAVTLRSKVNVAHESWKKDERRLLDDTARWKADAAQLMAEYAQHEKDSQEHNRRVAQAVGDSEIASLNQAAERGNAKTETLTRRHEELQRIRDEHIQRISANANRSDDVQRMQNELDQFEREIARHEEHLAEMVDSAIAGVSQLAGSVSAMQSQSAATPHNSSKQSSVPAPYIPGDGQPSIGTVGATKGDVWVIDGLGQKHRLRTGDEAFHQARMKTGPKGHFQVMLHDETILTVGPNSELVMDEYVYDPKTDNETLSAIIQNGIFRFVSGKLARKHPKKFKVQIPVGTIGPRGTDYVIEVDDSGATKAGVLSGAIVFQPNGSEEETWVRSGQQIEVGTDLIVKRCTSSDAPEQAARLLPHSGDPDIADSRLRLIALAVLVPTMFLLCGIGGHWFRQCSAKGGLQSLTSGQVVSLSGLLLICSASVVTVFWQPSGRMPEDVVDHSHAAIVDQGGSELSFEHKKALAGEDVSASQETDFTTQVGPTGSHTRSKDVPDCLSDDPNAGKDESIHRTIVPVAPHQPDSGGKVDDGMVAARRRFEESMRQKQQEAVEDWKRQLRAIRGF